MLDPTLLTTRRGQVWIDRASASGLGPQLSTSATLLDIGSDDIASAIPAYYPRFRSMPWHLPPRRLHAQIDPVSGSGELQNHLGVHGLAAYVADDFWGGMLLGGCLIARRPITLDLFVQAGLRVVFDNGHDVWRRLQGDLEVQLGEPLMAALYRRVRYLAVATSGWDSETDGKNALVLDRGVGSFR